MRSRIAIIGTGIAGLGCAYALRDTADCVAFEKEALPGGHSNTVNANGIPIDTGFMVYNNKTYPNLTRLFEELNVDSKPAPMSFGLQCMGLEYGGHGLNSFFAQRQNLLKPRLYKLLFAIRDFNRDARRYLESPSGSATLGEFLLEYAYSPDLIQLYLIPMCAAIWSSTFEDMLQYPAATLFRFLKNHGLIGFSTHLPWLTVKGGSRDYVEKLAGRSGAKFRLQCQVLSVKRRAGSVRVQFLGPDNCVYEEEFDRAVIASHANQALAMLETPTPLEEELLSSFRYSRNPTYLHTDSSVMPKNRRAWAAWNYKLEDPGLVATTHYWMNSLQSLPVGTQYFVSLDSRELPQIDPAKIVKRLLYHHPIFDLEAVEAQSRLHRLNEQGSIYYCGSYFGYGFHEDALVSGQRAARKILLDRFTDAGHSQASMQAEA